MKFKEFLPEEKVRLDPKCWTGKKIGNPKTKMKGGVRVNNCVPAESINEFASPGGDDREPNEEEILRQLAAQWWLGTEQQMAKAQQTLAAMGWEIGQDESGDDDAGVFLIRAGDVNGNSYMAFNHSDLEDLTEGLTEMDKSQTPPGRDGSNDPDAGKKEYPAKATTAKKVAKDAEKILNKELNKKPGMAEGKADYNFDIEDLKRLERIRDLATLKAQALVLISKPSAKPMRPEKVEWFKNALERMNSPMKVIKMMYDLMLSGEGNAVIGTKSSMNPNNYRQRFGEQGVAEEFNPEYDDEAGMAQGSLHTLQNAVEGLQQVIDAGDNLPEWCQEKISLAEDYLVTVWDYLQSEKAQGVDPEITEMFEAMDQLAEEMAVKNGVSADLVWEQFEALPDNVLYETAAWRRKEGKSKKGGLNAKGVASYRRENPGSKLQMAVTTKPSKLKPGSKAAKRRKSFCARMSGVKGPMKKPNGKPTRKALALRKWNC
jgi:hypothetical protein